MIENTQGIREKKKKITSGMPVQGQQSFSEFRAWYVLVKLSSGPSINDVSNQEGEGSKIGQNCQRLVLKNFPHGGGGCQKFGKIATSFMDGTLTPLTKLTKSIIMDLNLWPVLSILVYVYKYLNSKKVVMITLQVILNLKQLISC